MGDDVFLAFKICTASPERQTGTARSSRSAESGGTGAAERSSTENSRLGSDPARIKRDADELALLAQSIPQDVDQTAKGMLPKDPNAKLKKSGSWPNSFAVS